MANHTEKGKTMKAVLISIQPKWCELIASGKKTVEIRKTRPKLEPVDEPFKVYIYCTKDKNGWFDFGKKERLDGMVIGEFVCDKISIFRPNSLTCESAIKKASCLTVQGLIDYAGKKNHLFGWHISSLKIYDKPMDVQWLQKPTDPNAWWPSDISIQRSPQSWCYVEEMTDNG
jgi:predicted transcriptional regulator